MNANKGFLLNSYKSQLTEVTKERDQYINKKKELESENNSLRTKNVKLKAKVQNNAHHIYKVKLNKNSDNFFNVDAMMTRYYFGTKFKYVAL